MSSKNNGGTYYPITMKITGSFSLGGYKQHTTYKIDIVYRESSWCIYRRYKSFYELNQSIFNHVGEERAKGINVEFPKKEVFGSTMSTMTSIVSARILGLQKWVDSAIDCFGEELHGVFETFADITSKGKSGVAIQMGSSKILRESFAKTKIVRNMFGVWSTTFLVILKTGVVLVLSSIYDNSTAAVLSINLGAADTKVIPNGANGISILSKDSATKLKISFNSASDAAFWMRAISDLATNTEYVPDAASGRPEVRPASQAAPSSQKVEHIRAEGTGNTADELSVLYGM